MTDNIYIKIGNEYLDLDDNVSIQFIWNSPLFDAELLKGSYSYPFNLSLRSEKNRRLMGRPDDVKNSTTIVERIDCVLGLFGKEYASYLKTAHASRGQSLSTACFIKDSALTSARDKSIRSYDLGVVDVSNDSSFKEMHINWGRTLGVNPTGADVEINLNNFNYVCSVHALDLINTSAIWKDCLDNLVAQINTDTSLHHIVASRGPEVTIGDGFPMLKVVSDIPGNDSELLITKIYNKTAPAFYPFIYFQSTYNNGAVLTEYMTRTVFGLGDTRVTFAPMYFDNFYSDEDYIWFNVANYWNGLSFITTVDTDYGVPVITLPFFKYVVTSIFESIGYAVTGAFFDDAELSKLVFFSTKPADNVQPVQFDAPYGTALGIRKTNVYADIIPIAEQLPDLSLTKMISMHRNTFAVYYIFNHEEKQIRVGFLKDVLAKIHYVDWSGKSTISETVMPLKETGVTLKYNNDTNDNAIQALVNSIEGYRILEPVAHVNDLPITGNKENDLCLVIADNSFYKTNFLKINNAFVWDWQFYSLNLYDYVYQGGSLQIDSGNSLHLMREYEDIPMPYFDQAAMSVPFNQPELNFTSRLMFYRGIKNYVITFPLPSLIVSPTITREADEDENYSMQWDGDKGLYEQFHKKWLQFLSNTVPVEKQLDLKSTDLNSIQWDEWYRIEGVNYLIEKITFSVTKKKRSTVTANLYTKT